MTMLIGLNFGIFIFFHHATISSTVKIRNFFQISCTLTSLPLALLMNLQQQTPVFARASDELSYRYIAEGIKSFKNNNIQESIFYFDKAAAENPSVANHLWQRGISLYYSFDYKGCLQQFLQDIPFNSNDTEEVVWSILCAARLDASTFNSPMNPLDIRLSNELKQLILKNSRIEDDSRPIMRNVQSLFINSPYVHDIDNYNTGSSDAFNQAYEHLNSIKDDIIGGSDYFYANLYLSLYEQMSGDLSKSSYYAELAARSVYAKSKFGRDYMVAVARENNISLQNSK